MSLRLIKIVLYTSLCLSLSSLAGAQDSFEEKNVEVALRMIGHQVLLCYGDSTSRVLPVSKKNDQYIIQFENEFAFVPEELVAIVDCVVEESGIPNEFILEVEECISSEVVYSYKVDYSETSNMIPCGARFQPKACYNILFTFKTAADMNAQITNAAVEFSNESISEKNPFSSIPFYMLFLLMIIGVIFFVRRRKKSAVLDPNLIPIGKYYFNKRNTELQIEDQRIELTSKEADLLLFLYDTVNTTVEREVILNRVWGDEGDYVGRTLDVFISKLRKKLEADSSIKIINIRGVGYKLVADV